MIEDEFKIHLDFIVFINKKMKTENYILIKNLFRVEVTEHFVEFTFNWISETKRFIIKKETQPMLLEELEKLFDYQYKNNNKLV